MDPAPRAAEGMLGLERSRLKLARESNNSMLRLSRDQKQQLTHLALAADTDRAMVDLGLDTIQLLKEWMAEVDEAQYIESKDRALRSLQADIDRIRDREGGMGSGSSARAPPPAELQVSVRTCMQHVEHRAPVD